MLWPVSSEVLKEEEALCVGSSMDSRVGGHNSGLGLGIKDHI